MFGLHLNFYKEIKSNFNEGCLEFLIYWRNFVPSVRKSFDRNSLEFNQIGLMRGMDTELYHDDSSFIRGFVVLLWGCMRFSFFFKLFQGVSSCCFSVPSYSTKLFSNLTICLRFSFFLGNYSRFPASISRFIKNSCRILSIYWSFWSLRPEFFAIKNLLKRFSPRFSQNC